MNNCERCDDTGCPVCDPEWAQNQVPAPPAAQPAPDAAQGDVLRESLASMLEDEPDKYGDQSQLHCEAAAMLRADAERIAELERDRDDFCMDYRMRCDEQTKHLHVALKQSEERFMALCKKVADGMPPLPPMLIPAEGWNAAVQERAERAEAEVERLKQELDESRSDVCEPKCAALKADAGEA